MKSRKQINSEDFTLIPVFVEDIKVNKEELDPSDVDILMRFEKGRVYKAYREASKIYVFLEPDKLDAFVFSGLTVDIPQYSIKMVEVTTDNIHDLDIADFDMPLVESLMTTTMSEEVGKAAKIEQDMYGSPDDPTPSKDELFILFDALSGINPKLSRAVVELVRIMTMQYSTDNQIDKIINGIFFDVDMGKGACLSHAMKGILEYTTKGDNPKPLVDAASVIMVELSRKLKNYA